MWTSVELRLLAAELNRGSCHTVSSTSHYLRTYITHGATITARQTTSTISTGTVPYGTVPYSTFFFVPENSILRKYRTYVGIT